MITPTGDVLPGITRSAVLELAADLLEVVERPVSCSELAQADELFITSTTKEILPIVRVDDQTIADGRVGGRTQQLSELFCQAVRREPISLLSC